MTSRGRFTLVITCSGCGQPGSVTWEENSNQQPHGVQRILVAMTGTFHAEHGRTQSGDPVIVCDACDQIQDD